MYFPIELVRRAESAERYDGIPAGYTLLGQSIFRSVSSKILSARMPLGAKANRALQETGLRLVYSSKMAWTAGMMERILSL